MREEHVEHPDITSALLTGYERSHAPPVVTVWQVQAIPHEDAFPHEREDD